MMKAPVPFYKDYLDEHGNPAGGSVESVGIDIQWQNGPLKIGERMLPPNGAFPETVLRIAKHRLEFYQTTKFACAENAATILKLDQAIEELTARFTRRDSEGVLGTHALDATKG